MSAEILQQAAVLAERLASSLRHTIEDPSWVAGPIVDLTDVERLLPDVRQALVQIKRTRSLDQITGAAGNAATHPWEASEVSGEIQCPVCLTHPVGYLLADGRVPPCDATSSCPHAVITDGDGVARCIYCKTAYPATDEVAAGGAR